MGKNNWKIILFLLITAVIIALYFVSRSQKPASDNLQKNKATIPAQSQSEVSQESPMENVSEPATEESTPKKAPEKTIPEKHILQIPFYSQAPLSKWDSFHEEMCEEASILNAGLYLENKRLTKDQFEAELQKIQKIEKNEVGEWKSTTVAQTKKWADTYFEEKIKTKIINDPTAEDIEAEIAAGNPVVAPLAGRDIGNPNFTPPGPIYHMLVIKGFDARNFITNDVGTRKGESYPYKKEVIMKNIHDWKEKDIHAGAQRVLVLYKSN
jgi:cell division protein FtsN